MKISKLRAFLWRYVRRYNGEICEACGRPVRQVWHSDDALFRTTLDRAGDGLTATYCVNCFDQLTDEPVEWIAIATASLDRQLHDQHEESQGAVR